VQQEFLDDVPENLKWPRLRVHDEGKNVNQWILPPEKKQCAAVLQLSVVYDTLVFEICHVDAVPKL
jgi:hypothetical protein